MNRSRHWFPILPGRNAATYDAPNHVRALTFHSQHRHSLTCVHFFPI
jgi:hypothetical protein